MSATGIERKIERQRLQAFLKRFSVTARFALGQKADRKARAFLVDVVCKELYPNSPIRSVMKELHNQWSRMRWHSKVERRKEERWKVGEK